MNGTPVLIAEDLCLDVRGRKLLDYVSLMLSHGEMLGVIGPNGAGKSTLLKVLAGVIPATAGNVHLLGRRLREYRADALARKLAWLEQRPTLHWPLSVEQVVALGRLPWRATQYTDQDHAAVEEALGFTGTLTLRKREFPTLSEGEKLLVNLARVLATRPDIILADEPTAALDPHHQLLVLELLQKLANQGTAVLVVLHELNLAARFCKQLVLMDKGARVMQGSPPDVLTKERLRDIYRIDASVDAQGRISLEGRTGKP